MSIRIPGHVDEEGRIVPVHPERTARFRGRAVWFTLHGSPAVGLRSDAGNRYLWGVIYATIAEETGNDPESIHLALKREAVKQGILDPEFIVIGDVLHEADPTTRTDPDTFQRYTAWCKDYSLHKLNILIPEMES